jgi:hypothetical protein
MAAVGCTPRQSSLASEVIPGPYFLKGAHDRDHTNGRTKPRGSIIGQWGGPPRTEAEHFAQCPLCGGYVDMRDLVCMEEHQQPLPHPACDRAQ